VLTNEGDDLGVLLSIPLMLADTARDSNNMTDMQITVILKVMVGDAVKITAAPTLRERMETETVTC